MDVKRIQSKVKRMNYLKKERSINKCFSLDFFDWVFYRDFIRKPKNVKPRYVTSIFILVIVPGKVLCVL